MRRILALALWVMLALCTIAAPASALEGRAGNKGIAGLRDIPIQAKHTPGYGEEIVDLNKHNLSLKKGKTATLKATIKPGGKTLKVTWKSSNPKIAKVSSKGKITAVAPGVAIITATAKKYSFDIDGSGSSNECYVTVKAGSKDPKPIGDNDRTYYYGKTRLKAPTIEGNYEKALAEVKRKIGGYSYVEYEYPDVDDDIDGYKYTGLIYGSKIVNKAHTDIYFSKYLRYSGYGFVAKGKSPIKTYRGITIGAKKSAVQKKYGLPTEIYQYKDQGKTYERYIYVSRSMKSGKAQYTRTIFEFQKSKGKVSKIYFYCGMQFM